MKTKKENDWISGLFWLAVSIFMCFKSFQVGVGTIRSPGPGFVPFWAGVILALLTLFLLVKSLSHREDAGREAPVGRGRSWTRALLFFLILCLYTILLQRIGYLLSTFGLMLALLSFSERMKWWRLLLGSILISSVTYIVFCLWLGVQLPGGILG